MRLLLLGSPEELEAKLPELRAQHGMDTERLERGCVVLRGWNLQNEDAWADLARLGHSHGFIPVPVTNPGHARNVARAYLDAATGNEPWEEDGEDGWAALGIDPKAIHSINKIRIV